MLDMPDYIISVVGLQEGGVRELSDYLGLKRNSMTGDREKCFIIYSCFAEYNE
jgi:hypothetical protein